MKQLKSLKKTIELLSRKETFSVVLIMMFFIATLYIIFVSPQLFHSSVREGDIALKDVYAPYDFTYFWEIDEEGTKKAKLTAARFVPYYFQRKGEYENKLVAGFENFFDILDVEKNADTAMVDKLTNLKTKTGEGVSDKDLKILLEYQDTNRLRKKTINILKSLFVIGYANDNDLQYLKGNDAKKVSIF